jgi:hypothetical protein
VRWIDKGTASFLVEDGRIIGTVALLDDRTWAWSAWESYGGSPIARGRAETRLNARAAVERALE